MKKPAETKKSGGAQLSGRKNLWNQNFSSRSRSSTNRVTPPNSIFMGMEGMAAAYWPAAGMDTLE